MYIILVYDVSVERLNKVRNYLKRYLNWVQNSAFEGELRKGELEKIKLELKKLIDENEDSILLYETRDRRLIKKERIGVEKNPVTTII